ncbi:MAG: hypothetical protein LBI83_18735 [Stenotrophomonas maltophilia]|jgi:hypothetical protein|nr:hypothetical protein [Stenotrophomonas maltophilia]
MSAKIDLLACLRETAENLRSAGMPIAAEEMQEVASEVASLIKAGDRLTAAFRALGLDNSLVNRSRLARACEEAMVAFDTALARVKGGAA